jgi:hypothetical protein
VLKKLLFVVLALVLLVLPLAVRWLYFYEGKYEPGEVVRPDLQAIDVPPPEMQPFVDRYTAVEQGSILIDQAHSNRVDMEELTLLQARLTARGQQLEPVEDADDLGQRLRYAKALVVISPGDDWTSDEIERVEDFVDKGGRLLLVADPTRFDIDWDLLEFDSDVRHLNDLAAQFGLLFQSDYLYNTVENEGNFRNIRLTDFAAHELTRGLERVVLYAARSIVSEERALITTAGETRSSSSEEAEELAVAVLAADGAVLALGDLTFMMEPYNSVYDNDRFLGNIADFLAGAERQYELADFPQFFDDQVSLIYVGDPLLDSDLLLGGSDLQSLFADEGKELTVLEEEDKAFDTLFLGLYQETEEVESYLAAAQVTLVITQSGEALEEAGEPAEEGAIEATPTPVPEMVPTPIPTEPVTMTPALTVTPEITATPALTSEQEITVTAELSPSVPNRIQIESLGEMVVTGTSMLILQTDGERHVLVVLADTETGLEDAILRLTEGDLQGCLLRETETPTPTVLALCPTGEVGPGEGGGGWQEPELEPMPPTPTLTPTPPITETVEPLTDTLPVVTETVEPPEPVGEPEGSVLVIALDEGEGRYDSMTSADDYAAILGARYEVTVWSKAQDGFPDMLDLLDYDLLIWTAGDFEDAFGDEESEVLYIVMLEGIPVIASGAFVGDTGTESVQRDIQVHDATHPMAAGFGEEEVIPFVLTPSGSEYETSVLEEVEEWDTTIVPFVRGPESEDPGVPAVYVVEDEYTGMRLVLVGFPIYLLPEDARSQFVLNMADWLVGSE